MSPKKNIPNILLIYADQHRYDALGCSGNPLVKTPSLDRLAREGIRFRHAFTPIPTCCPARQSLLCGRRPELHGGLWNFNISLPVPLFNEPVWTQDLNESGYLLGCVGKLDVHPRKTPLDYGFHHWVSRNDYSQWRKQQALPEQQPLKIYDINGWHPFGGIDPIEPHCAKTHWYADKAIELIRGFASEGKPWHLALNFDEPHLPCYPTPDFARLYSPAQIPEWGSFYDTFENKPYIQKQQIFSWGLENLGWSEWSQYVALYLAMVSQIDDAVGHLLNALDAMGLAESTMVIYSTDHGDACGSHRHIDKHYNMYDDVMRVPLIIRWPGVARSGLESEAFVCNGLDLAATIPEAAGLTVPENYQGRSLIPLLAGDTPADWPQDVVATYNGQQFGLFTQRMLRNKNFKYIWNLTDVDEFYDLAKDPWEVSNRIDAPEYRQTIAAMRLRLWERLKQDGDRILNPQWTERQLIEGRKINRR